MIVKELKVKNIFGEKLDVLIEGNEQAEEIIVFVHGFGTDKNEGFNLHRDITDSLKNDFLICRFDQSGYGKSEGESEDSNAEKISQDLKSILNFIKKEYPRKKINIFAHSLGTFAVSLLSPNNIQKTVFTGVVNLDLKIIAEKIRSRIMKFGGKFDEAGNLLYLRTSGITQKVGPKFFQVLEQNNFKKILTEFSQKTNLILYRPKQDEIVLGGGITSEYKEIKNIRYLEINGDHNFIRPEDRKNLIAKIREFMIK